MLKFIIVPFLLRCLMVIVSRNISRYIWPPEVETLQNMSDVPWQSTINTKPTLLFQYDYDMAFRNKTKQKCISLNNNDVRRRTLVVNT